MKKLMVFVALVTVLTTLAAACAPAATPEPTKPPAAPPTSAPAQAAPTQPPAPTAKPPEPTKAPVAAGPKVYRIGRGAYPDVLDPQKSSYGIEIEFLKPSRMWNVIFVPRWHQDDVPHPRWLGALGWHARHRGRL